MLIFVVVVIWVGRFSVSCGLRIVRFGKRRGDMMFCFLFVLIVIIEIGVIFELVFVVVGIRMSGRCGFLVLLIFKVLFRFLLLLSKSVISLVIFREELLLKLIIEVVLWFLVVLMVVMIRFNGGLVIILLKWVSV